MIQKSLGKEWTLENFNEIFLHPDHGSSIDFVWDIGQDEKRG